MGCPRCGSENVDLSPVDTSLKVALSATGEGAVPTMVCANCLAELTSRVSQGLKLRMEKEAREKNKLMLWKSRVNLIKQARGLMAQKAYSEAAVSYEKYLRVLEMVYNLKKGELSPNVFNSSKRSKELTVVASVYWDLVRIYDTSPRYGSRMTESASKLAQFLPFSPILPDVVKRAEAFARSAKNPAVMRQFLKAVRGASGRCFIATAVFNSNDCQEVLTLRQFRDEFLLSSTAGRRFVFWYYNHSPPVADWLQQRTWAQNSLRPLFRLVALAAKKSLNSHQDSYNS